MSKTKKLFIVLLTLSLLMFCSCAPTGTDDGGTATPTPTPSPSPEIVQGKVIEASTDTPVNETDWSLVDEYPHAFTIDNADFAVQLYVKAATDEDGYIAYDDGQEWALVVTDGSVYYNLIDEYVQLGKIHFEVSDYYDGDTVIPGVTAIVTSGAGFSLKRYELFTANTFTERILYDASTESDAGINRRYSSL